MICGFISLAHSFIHQLLGVLGVEHSIKKKKKQLARKQSMTLSVYESEMY